MKQQDWDFIENLKTEETFGIETLNEIKKIALVKRDEFLKLSEFLQRFKKVNFIYDIFLNKEFDYKNWKTLLVYWTFRRLGESLGTTLSLDNNVPIVSERLIKRFDSVFLNNINNEVIGVSSELNKLIVIDSKGETIFEDGLMYHPVSNFIGNDFVNIVNNTLSVLGIDQSFNIYEGYQKIGEKDIKVFYSMLSNSKSSVYVNFWAPLLTQEPEEQSFRIFVTFPNDIPKVANVNYIFKDGKYSLKVEEVHNVSTILNTKEQENMDMVRQRIMHEFLKTNY